MLNVYSLGTVALLAAMSPGPDFAIVVKNALKYDRRAGIFTALGVGSALFIHTLYSIFGLALVIAHSLLLFSMIKYAGAAYLIYIGSKELFSKSLSHLTLEKTAALQKRSNRKAYLDGFLTNVLNPKCIFFILSVFTLFITPTTPRWQQLGYGFEIAIIAALWFSILSCIMHLKWVQQRINTIQQKIVKVMGALLVGIGVFVATMVSHY